jgi:hypothetical protein
MRKCFGFLAAVVLAGATAGAANAQNHLEIAYATKSALKNPASYPYWNTTWSQVWGTSTITVTKSQHANQIGNGYIFWRITNLNNNGGVVDAGVLCAFDASNGDYQLNLNNLGSYAAISGTPAAAGDKLCLSFYTVTSGFFAKGNVESIDMVFFLWGGNRTSAYTPSANVGGATVAISAPSMFSGFDSYDDFEFTGTVTPDSSCSPPTMDTSVYIIAYVFDDENGKGSSYGDGVPFVVETLSLSSDAYDYGSVSVSVLDLDSGYDGYVVFETRWYGVGNSYSDYVSDVVMVGVSN